MVSRGRVDPGRKMAVCSLIANTFSSEPDPNPLSADRSFPCPLHHTALGSARIQTYEPDRSPTHFQSELGRDSNCISLPCFQAVRSSCRWALRVIFAIHFGWITITTLSKRPANISSTTLVLFYLLLSKHSFSSFYISR